MLLLEHILFFLSFTGQINYDLVWFYYRFIITKWGDMALLASGLAVVGQAFTFEIFPQILNVKIKSRQFVDFTV